MQRSAPLHAVPQARKQQVCVPELDLLSRSLNKRTVFCWLLARRSTPTSCTYSTLTGRLKVACKRQIARRSRQELAGLLR